MAEYRTFVIPPNPSKPEEGAQVITPTEADYQRRLAEIQKEQEAKAQAVRVSKP